MYQLFLAAVLVLSVPDTHAAERIVLESVTVKVVDRDRNVPLARTLDRFFVGGHQRSGNDKD